MGVGQERRSGAHPTLARRQGRRGPHAAASIAGALATALCGALASSPAWAFECKVSEQFDYVSLNWEVRSISYGVRRPGSTQLDDAAVARAVDAAFEAWMKPACTDVRFVPRGFVDETAKTVNQVVFVSQGWRFATDAVALTRTTYGKEDGIIRAATIEVNEDIFRFVDAGAGCSMAQPAYDLSAVLTHEVGHLLGLDHTTHFSRAPTDPTMAPEVGPCEMDKRTIEADDVAGLCLLYPAGEPSGPCKRIPAQDGAYVENTPFGCTAAPGAGARGGSTLGLWGLLAVLFLRRERRIRGIPPSRSCPKFPSG